MKQVIKVSFDSLFKDVVFDRKLLGQLIQFRIRYLHKTDGHTDFFSHGYTGVQNQLYFTYHEFADFYQLLKINPDDVNKAIRQSPTFNPDWKIEGDPYNQVCVYLSHRFLTSPLLNQKEKTDGAFEGIMLFLIRSISAIITDRFIYPADPEIAAQTYENLSGKFLIKQLGNWYEVLKYRSTEVINPNGLHYKTLMNYDSEVGIRYILTDTQTHVSSLVKNIYAEHVNTAKAGERVKKVSFTGADMEGVDSFKDSRQFILDRINYINGIIPSKDSLVTPNLLTLSLNILPTAQASLIEKTLSYIASHCFDSKKGPEVQEYVKLSVRYTLNYMIDNNLNKVFLHDPGGLMKRIKGALNSSRSSDTELINLREVGETTVRNALGRPNPQVIKNTRTAVTLYLFLKAYFYKD